jgi:hypothetical protein
MDASRMRDCVLCAIGCMYAYDLVRSARIELHHPDAGCRCLMMLQMRYDYPRVQVQVLCTSLPQHRRRERICKARGNNNFWPANSSAAAAGCQHRQRH